MKRFAIALLLPLFAIPLAAQDPVKIPAKKDDFLLFLLVGQSNMAGRGKPIEKADMTPHPRVVSLAKDKTWTPAIDPLHFDKTAAGVGLGTTFGKILAEKYPDKTIGLIPAAFGGSPIKSWAQTENHYKNAIERAKLAQKAGTLVGILWHQGESDSNANQSPLYQERLDQLVDSFRTDLGAKDVPFIVGALSDSVQSPEGLVVQKALKTLSDRKPNVAWVDAKGLTMSGDKIHFSAPSYREFGKRYAEAYLGVKK